MSKKLYTDSVFTAIANAIRSKLGVNTTYKTREMAAAIAQIHGEPVLETLTAVENNTYSPSSGKDGFSQVTVAVPATIPVLQEKTVTQNGNVTPDQGYDGLSKVVVNVGENVNRTVIYDSDIGDTIQPLTDLYNEIEVEAYEGNDN